MGYQMVAIRFEDQGRMRSYTVHRLVALAYHGPRPDGLDIAHGNCIKTDNRPSNLRYTTRSDNILDSLRMGQWPQGGGREAIYPWREMEVGESFRANPMSRASIQGTVSNARRRYERDFTIASAANDDGSWTVTRVA